jgi:hypothetical protein
VTGVITDHDILLRRVAAGGDPQHTNVAARVPSPALTLGDDVTRDERVHLMAPTGSASVQCRRRWRHLRHCGRHRSRRLVVEGSDRTGFGPALNLPPRGVGASGKSRAFRMSTPEYHMEFA